jgi:hypothetical protein
VNAESKASQPTRAEASEFTATGISKRISYDVIQLPSKPRRLQKKSIEYVKSPTVLKSLKKRSQELMQNLKSDRLKHFHGSRPIPKDFIKKR